MKICRICGAKMPESTKFCAKCRTPFIGTETRVDISAETLEYLKWELETEEPVKPVESVEIVPETPAKKSVSKNSVPKALRLGIICIVFAAIVIATPIIVSDYTFKNREVYTDTYKGQYKNGVPDGKGKMKYSNGDYYKGEWKNGKPNGKGTYIQTYNGKYGDDIYKGNFIDGRLNGYGKYISKEDGEFYEGEWIDDWRTGKGKYQYGEWLDFESEEGIFWDDDLWNGVEKDRRGKIINEVLDGEYLGLKISYEGETTNKGVPNGQGKQTYDSGAVYEGEFKNGKRDGYGIMKFADAVYEGEWKDDWFDGQGKLTYQNGVHEGEFKDGLAHGQGKYTYSGGRGGYVDEGEYRYNDLWNGVHKNEDGEITSEYKDGERERVEK